MRHNSREIIEISSENASSEHKSRIDEALSIA